MGLPKIQFSFKEKAETFKERNDKGIVSIIIKDGTLKAGPYELYKDTEIPATMNQGNTAYVKRAFIGGVNAPEKVIVYCVASAAEDLSDAFSYFRKRKVGYLAGPLDGEYDAEMIAFCNSENERGHKVKLVTATKPDKENRNVVYVKDTTIIGEKEIAASELCSRIAGLIAGTPVEQAVTYAVLNDIDLPENKETPTELDESIDAGEFRLFRDLDKIRVASGVNYAPKTSKYHKIKYTDTVDMIEEDITGTIKNEYIGKVPNSYDNKCILIVYAAEYLTELEKRAILVKGASSVSIDIEAQKTYLKSINVDTSSMTDEDIKKYEDTGDNVFLLVDAIDQKTMENVHIAMTI